MLGTVMTEVMEPPERVLIPTSDVNPLRTTQKSGGSNVGGGRPSGRTMDIFSVFWDSLRVFLMFSA